MKTLLIVVFENWAVVFTVLIINNYYNFDLYKGTYSQYIIIIISYNYT